MAFSRASFYLEHGKVRYKAPYSDSVSFQIRAPEKGSVEFEAAILILGPAATAIGLNISGSLIYDFIKAVFKRATGSDTPEDLAPWDKRVPRGSFDAIADSIQNPLKRAHTPIGSTASNIVIVSGSNNKVVFNNRTKQYLFNDNFNAEVKQKAMYVTAMNGRDRTGRIFMRDEGRGVGFSIDHTTSDAAVELLLWSHSQYFRKKDADIFVTYQAYETIDEKVKRIVVRNVTPADPSGYLN